MIGPGQRNGQDDVGYANGWKAGPTLTLVAEAGLGVGGPGAGVCGSVAVSNRLDMAESTGPQVPLQLDGRRLRFGRPLVCSNRRADLRGREERVDIARPPGEETGGHSEQQRQ
jgi:hypothetical protein